MSLSLGWYPADGIEPNSLNFLLSKARMNSFSFITIPMAVNNEEADVLNIYSVSDLMKWQRSLTATSDRCLDDPSDWTDRILFKIDANEIKTHLNLDYAAHLSVFAVLIENWTVEQGVSIACNFFERQYCYSLYFACDFTKWSEWNKLSQSLTSSDFASRFYRSVGVIPIIKDKSTSTSMSLIWKAEPLKGLIIVEEYGLVSKESENQLSLRPELLDLEIFLKTIYKVFPVPIIIKCKNENINVLSYYVRSLLDPIKFDGELTVEELELKEFAAGFENVLQTPLQPLRDHLPSETYQVFEKDPVKYRLYREAIEAALQDIVKRESVDKNDMKIKIAVFGAGRGPIVQCVLDAIDEILKYCCSRIKVSIKIVEKNPFACLTLLDRFKTYPHIQLIFADMRNLLIDNGDQLVEKKSFDLIISELLGSFGDNELSPECLWSVEDLLKSEGGICIPQRYTSFIEPCFSPILRSQVVEYQVNKILPGDPFDYAYVTHPSRVYFPSKPLAVFSFSHPSELQLHSSDQSTKLTFNFNITASMECVIDGLMGYFECFLYKNIKMSTLPSDSTPGMLSWFPIYFPLRRSKIRKPPPNKNEDISISVEFKRVRCFDSNRIWYEWREDESEEFQNKNGTSYSIYL